MSSEEIKSGMEVEGDESVLRDRWNKPQGRLLNGELVEFWLSKMSSGVFDFEDFKSESKSEFTLRPDNDGRLDLNGIQFSDIFKTVDLPCKISNVSFTYADFSGLVLSDITFENVILDNSSFQKTRLKDIEIAGFSTFNNVDVRFASIESLKGLDKNRMEVPLIFEEISYRKLCQIVRIKYWTGRILSYEFEYTLFGHIETGDLGKSNQKLIKDYIDWFEHTMNRVRRLRKWGWNDGFEFFVLTSKNWSSFLILGRCILLFQLISALLIYFSLFIDKTCFKGIGGFWGSWYYTIVTFTTLGYGDAYPHNWWGKLIAGGIALVGYLSLALLIYLFTRKIDKTY